MDKYSEYSIGKKRKEVVARNANSIFRNLVNTRMAIIFVFKVQMKSGWDSHNHQNYRSVGFLCILFCSK